MRLFIKIIPLRAGTAEPAGEPRILPCPPDVEPDTILSFLTQRLGEVIETIWTSTERHERIDTGWVFPGTPATESQDAVEVACVPFIETADGSLQPMFEVQADQRLQFSQLASRGLGYTLIRWPQRQYQPTVGQDTSTPHPQQAGSVDQLDQALADMPARPAQPCAPTRGLAARHTASSCETTATTAASATWMPPSKKTAPCESQATTKAPA